MARLLFGHNTAGPGGATESAVIEAGVVLVAGEVAVFAKRSDVEPVTVGVEVILDEIFVPFNAVARTETAGGCPGFGFNAE